VACLLRGIGTGSEAEGADGKQADHGEPRERIEWVHRKRDVNVVFSVKNRRFGNVAIRCAARRTPMRKPCHEATLPLLKTPAGIAIKLKRLMCLTIS
jgi:hypothetical protein